MIEVVRDKDGNIQAVAEWFLVDNLGHFSEKGEYVWIEQVEFSQSVNGNGFGIIRQFIKKVADGVPWAKAGYFHRYKYQKDEKPRIRLYSRNQWLKLLKKEN